MARTVFFHVGLPKTGTTYLQSILWKNRDALRGRGILLPGTSSRMHLWASGAVRGEPGLSRRHPDAPRAWDALVEEVRGWDGTAVISHEFFAGASAEQASAALAALAPAEVHLVVTAREPVGLVTARWQELVKNGSTAHIDDYPLGERGTPGDEWGWDTVDLADVLERWAAELPPERVHVLTPPKRTEPRETLWLRFAGLLGIDPGACDASDSEQNASLGVVEVELLRRLNADLVGFDTPFDRGVWVRGYLAQGKLVPRKGERFWPAPQRVAELRALGDAAAELVASRGYDVLGDVADLRTPEQLPERRHPDSVTEAEMLVAATGTMAQMLADVRRLTRQNRRLQQHRPPGRLRRYTATLAARVRRRP